MLDDIKTCMERQDEEKLVFSHDQDTDPTIVIDPRSAFTSGNTAPIVDPVEEKEVAAPKKEGCFSKLVNKFKGLDTKAKVGVGVVTALVIAGIAFAIYLGVKPDTSLMLLLAMILLKNYLMNMKKVKSLQQTLKKERRSKKVMSLK